jgi:hypothetical protein
MSIQRQPGSQAQIVQAEGRRFGDQRSNYCRTVSTTGEVPVVHRAALPDRRWLCPFL